MKLLSEFFNAFLKSADKPINSDIADKKNIPPEKDRVANFNKKSPLIFFPRLRELGYELKNIEDFHHNGFLWSTRHYYVNDVLNLTLDIQQAPYYTDYGFSIFIFHTGLKDRKLLCNIPHELQDEEDKFLPAMMDRFFSDAEIVSILKGESWHTIKHLRSE